MKSQVIWLSICDAFEEKDFIKVIELADQLLAQLKKQKEAPTVVGVTDAEFRLKATKVLCRLFKQLACKRQNIRAHLDRTLSRIAPEILEQADRLLESRRRSNR